MAVPDIHPVPLTGKLLAAFVLKTIATLRVVATIPHGDQIRQSPGAVAALRYLGGHLMSIVPKVRDFLAETLGSGAFPGIGFTLEDYDLAVARAEDAQNVAAKLAALSSDAHKNAVATLQHLADLTLRAIKAYVGTMKLPSADPKIKDLLRAAGPSVDEAIAPIQESRKKSRLQTVALKAMDSEIGAKTELIQQYRTDEAVKKAQDTLKLASLTGEPLRPKDLVLINPVIGPVVGQADAAGSSAGRSGKQKRPARLGQKPAKKIGEQMLLVSPTPSPAPRSPRKPRR